MKKLGVSSKSKVRQLVTIKGRRCAETKKFCPKSHIQGFDPWSLQFHSSDSTVSLGNLLWESRKNKMLLSGKHGLTPQPLTSCRLGAGRLHPPQSAAEEGARGKQKRQAAFWCSENSGWHPLLQIPKLLCLAFLPHRPRGKPATQNQGKCSGVAGPEKKHPKGILGKVQGVPARTSNTAKRSVRAASLFPPCFSALGASLLSPAQHCFHELQWKHSREH